MNAQDPLAGVAQQLAAYGNSQAAQQVYDATAEIEKLRTQRAAVLALAEEIEGDAGWASRVLGADEVGNIYARRLRAALGATS